MCGKVQVSSLYSFFTVAVHPQNSKKMLPPRISQSKQKVGSYKYVQTVKQTLITEEYFPDRMPASHSTPAAHNFLQAIKSNENFKNQSDESKTAPWMFIRIPPKKEGMHGRKQ